MTVTLFHKALLYYEQSLNFRIFKSMICQKSVTFLKFPSDLFFLDLTSLSILFGYIRLDVTRVSSLSIPANS